MCSTGAPISGISVGLQAVGTIACKNDQVFKCLLHLQTLLRSICFRLALLLAKQGSACMTVTSMRNAMLPCGV